MTVDCFSAQSYEKIESKTKKLFLFLPRWSELAIFDGKITKKVEIIEQMAQNSRHLLYHHLFLGNNIADDLANKFFCVKPRRGVKITGRLRKPEGLIRIQTGVECVAERSTKPLLRRATGNISPEGPTEFLSPRRGF